MTGDDGRQGVCRGQICSVPIITKRVAALDRFTRRRWMQASGAEGSDGVGWRKVVWQVKGWMAGSKGEARFAPARCLRAAARPVGGGDAQTAGAVNSRIVKCRR
jgi:hypothetical protein